MSSDEEQCRSDLPFQEAVLRLRPGQWDARVLDQDQLWVDSAAVVHRISDLDDAHLANIVLMLRRDVIRVLVDHELATPRPVRVGDLGSPLSSPSTPLSVDSALGWLEHTVLWEALQAELVRRDLTTSGAATRIDEPVGVWAVRTHNAIYLLDLDRYRARRLPEPGAGRLRADQKWAPLHEVGQVRLGAEMRLLLTVTAGALTTRTTTPVTGIRRLPDGLADPDLARRAAAAWGPPPVEPALTEYRTAGFVSAAYGICDYWAGLAKVLHEAGVHARVLLVPRRLRDPHADPDAVDLCLTGRPPERPAALQADVDDVVGFHLPITDTGRYRTDAALHAVPFSPATRGTQR